MFQLEHIHNTCSMDVCLIDNNNCVEEAECDVRLSDTVIDEHMISEPVNHITNNKLVLLQWIPVGDNTGHLTISNYNEKVC